MPGAATTFDRVTALAARLLGAPTAALDLHGTCLSCHGEADANTWLTVPLPGGIGALRVGDRTRAVVGVGTVPTRRGKRVWFEVPAPPAE